MSRNTVTVDSGEGAVLESSTRSRRVGGERADSRRTGDRGTEDTPTAGRRAALEFEDAGRSRALAQKDRELRQVVANYERVIEEKERAYRELERAADAEAERVSDRSAWRRVVRRVSGWLER